MKAQLYERVTSPLTVSFVLSWCVWNFRLVAVLVSNMDPTAKFRIIDTVLYPDAWAFWLHRIVGPLVTCLFYVFVYPYPERWAFSWAKRKQRDLRSIQASLDSDVPLTPEQSRELRLKCKKAIEETQSIIDEHQEKAATLSKEIEQLNAKINQQNAQIDVLERRAGKMLLPDYHKKVLSTLKQGPNVTAEIKKSSGVNPIAVDDTLDELLQLGCIRQFNSVNEHGHGAHGWAVTQLGLKVLATYEGGIDVHEVMLYSPTLAEER
jgi:hypothetical protein